jgi:hypothetical protein
MPDHLGSPRTTGDIGFVISRSAVQVPESAPKNNEQHWPSIRGHRPTVLQWTERGRADGPLAFRSAPCTRAAPSTPPVLIRVRLRTGAHQAWPSPRHDRLGSRVVKLTRLPASLDVAARMLAPSVEALDTPLGSRDSHHVPGVCYSALQRLPRRDLHPLEKNDGMRALARPHRHDAPCHAL